MGKRDANTSTGHTVTEDGLDWKVEYNLPVSVFEKKKSARAFHHSFSCETVMFYPLSLSQASQLTGLDVNTPGNSLKLEEDILS